MTFGCQAIHSRTIEDTSLIIAAHFPRESYLYHVDYWSCSLLKLYCLELVYGKVIICHDRVFLPLPVPIRVIRCDSMIDTPANACGTRSHLTSTIVDDGTCFVEKTATYTIISGLNITTFTTSQSHIYCVSYNT